MVDSYGQLTNLRLGTSYNPVDDERILTSLTKLDLCLSFKEYKCDCPVNVDVATCQSQFLSHYYENKLRPRPAYAFGLIYWWAHIASIAPRLILKKTMRSIKEEFFEYFPQLVAHVEEKFQVGIIKVQIFYTLKNLRNQLRIGGFCN